MPASGREHSMNEDHILISLGAIGLGAIACQWLAWRLRLPAILFLLLAGICLGPLLGWLDPAALFGPLLFPVVSLSVAVILFEGSLTLRFQELTGIGSVVRRLVTVGLLATWAVITVTAHWLLDFPWDLALLFGTLTLVTGPTVIVPMLRVVRPKAAVANVLRWEGIVIDPLGALLAVVVYSFIVTREEAAAWSQSLQTFAAVIATGCLLGALGGWAMGQLLRRNWLPEFLHNLATLALVLAIFIGANALVHESGLLAVTVMGIWLANMRGVDVRHIVHFKEDLSMLLISGLFILLAARLDLAALLALGPGVLLLLAVIQFVARPLAVVLSSWGSPLSLRERLLLAWIAPRGIVAAAVSAIFAVRLAENGHDQAPLLVPLTFAVIIGTVVLQSATARPLARLLKVAEPPARGFLILGANPVARAIGKALAQLDMRVLLTDTNWSNIRAARMEDLPTYYGNPNSQHADVHLDRIGIGNLLAITPVDELNNLTSMRFRHEFGNDRLFTLASGLEHRRSEKHLTSEEHRGRSLGNPPQTYQQLAGRLARGATLNTTTLSETFDWENYQALYGTRASVLFMRDDHGRLQVVTADCSVDPEPGWALVALIDPEDAPSRGSSPRTPDDNVEDADDADSHTALHRQDISSGARND